MFLEIHVITLTRGVVWVKIDLAKAMILKKKFGQRFAKTCLWAYADREGPYQPERSCSLMSAFNVH